MSLSLNDTPVSVFCPKVEHQATRPTIHLHIMERVIASSKQEVGDNYDHRDIDEIRDSNNPSSHHAKARPTTRDTSDEADSEDEIGALIYQRSRTAKARAAVSEKANAKRTIPKFLTRKASMPPN